MNLRESYMNTKYKFLQHNQSRNLQVLQEALRHFDDLTDSDMYGSGSVINDFEQEVAEFLGMEDAIFFPSGTMAQQIALRIYCDEKGIPRVAYHPTCHLEIHEEDAIKELHHIDTLLLGQAQRLFTLDDLKAIDQPISALLIELPQREIGGLLPDFQDLVNIANYCKDHNIAIHLDGARLLEALPYYDKDIKEITQLFDSVYLSFYKTLGGVAGAILAGSSSMLKEAKVWKRRHGGDLISLYPYVLSSKYYFDLRKDRMAKYYKQAIKLAAHLNDCKHITTQPKVPMCNMFHMYIDLEVDKIEKLFTKIHQETNVGLLAMIRQTPQGNMIEISVGDGYSQMSKKKRNQFYKALEKACDKL